MHFYSTRDVAQKAIGIDAALNAGLAIDGGLYVPSFLPKLSTIDASAGLAEIAYLALQPFFAGSSLAPVLREICAESLNLPMPTVPLLKLDGVELLELFHGPTAAFKDFAARFLASCMCRLRDSKKPIGTVLVATSGDTGGAVAAAFHHRPGFRVVILYPDGRVAPRQAHQLGAFGGNVVAFKVDGSFDDCQAMVKAMFADQALRERVDLLSANSISLGRLLPQMAYYVYAASRAAAKHGSAIDLIIPTGNLGHGVGAMMARAMGAPIQRIVLACNANRTLARTFAGERYQAQPSISTLANAMDVGAPSNFERLAHLFADEIASQSTLAWSFDDLQITSILAKAPTYYGQIVCPHTACGLLALEQLDRIADRPVLIAATAHPAKFDTVVEPIIGQSIVIPQELAALLAKSAVALSMSSNAAELKTFLLGSD